MWKAGQLVIFKRNRGFEQLNTALSPRPRYELFFTDYWLSIAFAITVDVSFLSRKKLSKNTFQSLLKRSTISKYQNIISHTKETIRWHVSSYKRFLYFFLYQLKRLIKGPDFEIICCCWRLKFMRPERTRRWRGLLAMC